MDGGRCDFLESEGAVDGTLVTRSAFLLGAMRGPYCALGFDGLLAPLWVNEWEDYSESLAYNVQYGCLFRTTMTKSGQPMHQAHWKVIK